MNFTQKRVQLSIISALIFFILSHPQMYALTSKLPVIGKRLTKKECGSCPTSTGMVVHAVVFLLVMVYAMPSVRKFLNK